MVKWGMGVNRLSIDWYGEEFIKQFEGLRLSPYQDIAGVWTNGWGHTKNVTAQTPTLTADQAEANFQADLTPIEAAINKYVTINLSQNEFNALGSFAFNEGVGKFFSSTLLMKLNNGDRQGASKEFLRWVYYKDKASGDMLVSDDLKARRQAEQALFLKLAT